MLKTALSQTAGSLQGLKGRQQTNWIKDNEDALRALFEETM